MINGFKGRSDELKSVDSGNSPKIHNPEVFWS